MLTSSVRFPQLLVLANGSQISGAIEAQVHANNHFSADRFSVLIALSADRGAAQFWSSTSDVFLDVQMSVDGFIFKSLVQGAVDHIDLDMGQRLVRVEGRDLTAALIETRTQETFANQTSSEIASTLAQRHNLDARVAATSTPVGRYYQSEHDRITLNQFSRATTEWDLLTFLAQQEGYDVFVSGRTLFFQPSSTSMETTVVSLSSVLNLRLERALTLAQDIEVTVKSWNSRQQSAFTQTARKQARGQMDGTPQRYVYVRPNLTSDQALQFAQRKLAELSRHERLAKITMPGELSITPRSRISIEGTGTDFDQIYHVDVVERVLHVETGFIQHMRCKNANPVSEATPPGDIVASVTG